MCALDMLVPFCGSRHRSYKCFPKSSWKCMWNLAVSGEIRLRFEKPSWSKINSHSIFTSLHFTESSHLHPYPKFHGNRFLRSPTCVPTNRPHQKAQPPRRRGTTRTGQMEDAAYCLLYQISQLHPLFIWSNHTVWFSGGENENLLRLHRCFSGWFMAGY